MILSVNECPRGISDMENLADISEPQVSYFELGKLSINWVFTYIL